MTRAIVLDTDFLSAFLKIGRLALIRDFYGISALFVPSAVIRELSGTSLLPELTGIPWIRAVAPDTMSSGLPSTEILPKLGAGETEAILLAQEHEALLLTNDYQAGSVARRIGLKTVDIPSFLVSCRESGFLNRDGILEIVESLKEKDRYKFSREILDLLLA